MAVNGGSNSGKKKLISDLIKQKRSGGAEPLSFENEKPKVEAFSYSNATEYYAGKTTAYFMQGVSAKTATLQESKTHLSELAKRKAFYEELRPKMRELGNSQGFSGSGWETNNILADAVSEIDSIMQLQENAIKCFENGGEVVSFTDQHGKKYVNIPDFSSVDTTHILFDPETILTDELPKYVPVLDLYKLNLKKFAMDTIELGSDRFLLCLSSYRSPYQHVGQLNKPNPDAQNHFVVVNLDQLVLTSDYYVSKQKAINIDESAKRNERQINYWHGLPLERKKYYIDRLTYEQLSAKEKKQFSKEKFNAMSVEEKAKEFPRVKTYGVKRVQLSDSAFQKEGKRTMPASLHYMYEDFVDKTAEPFFHTDEKTGRKSLYGNTKIFDYWDYLKEALKWKLVDIREQRKEISESRQAGMETSYGMSNTSEQLLEKYGLYVKRQNGDSITAKYVDDIETSYNSIQSVFGSLRKFTAEQPLVISHSDKTYMYASRAIGVYISVFHAIGVSQKYGPDQFSDTFAHELAHMIDNRLGEKRGRRFLSDDRNSAPALIAYTFRKLMNDKTDSDYLNSTKECFARAMQMHYAIQTRGDNAAGVYDVMPPKDTKPYHSSPAFVSLQNYHAVIKPAIEAFFDAYKEDFMPFEGVMKTEATERPECEVDTSINAAVKDVKRAKGLTFRTALFFVQKVRSEDWPETQYGFPAAESIEERMLMRLVDVGWVTDDFTHYQPTEAGMEYYSAVMARWQTRKGVAAGTDMFPELANIYECEGKDFPKPKPYSKPVEEKPSLPMAMRPIGHGAKVNTKDKFLQTVSLVTKEFGSPMYVMPNPDDEVFGFTMTDRKVEAAQWLSTNPDLPEILKRAKFITGMDAMEWEVHTAQLNENYKDEKSKVAKEISAAVKRPETINGQFGDRSNTLQFVGDAKRLQYAGKGSKTPVTKLDKAIYSAAKASWKNKKPYIISMTVNGPKAVAIDSVYFSDEKYMVVWADNDTFFNIQSAKVLRSKVVEPSSSKEKKAKAFAFAQAQRIRILKLKKR